MTKKSAVKIQQAADACGVSIKFRSTGTQRVQMILGDKTYGGVNKAMDAIASEYMRKKK
jgi:phosphotransferase system IIB component